MSNLEIKRLSEQFKYIYGIKAWYGPPITQALDGIDSEQALKSHNGSHNIAELVHHMTAWRVFAIKKLEGDETYDVSPEMNFVKISKQTDDEWAELKNKLEQSQNRILELLKETDDSILDKIVPPGIAPRIYSFYVLLQGIIQHDIYHLGQIVLLKK